MNDDMNNKIKNKEHDMIVTVQNNIVQEEKIELKSYKEREQMDNDYSNSEFAVEKHNFHHDYDNYRCPDCDGLGYFYSSPSDLGGLGTFLFPKKECGKCNGKGFIDID